MPARYSSPSYYINLKQCGYSMKQEPIIYTPNKHIRQNIRSTMVWYCRQNFPKASLEALKLFYTQNITYIRRRPCSLKKAGKDGRKGTREWLAQRWIDLVILVMGARLKHLKGQSWEILSWMKSIWSPKVDIYFMAHNHDGILGFCSIFVYAKFLCSYFKNQRFFSVSQIFIYYSKDCS